MSTLKIGISEAVGGGVNRIQLTHKYEDIISLENLCLAWEEFISGKKKQQGVADFRRNLMDNIIALHEDLANKRYIHGGYKERHIWERSEESRDPSSASGGLRMTERICYIRYADDFVFLHESREFLEAHIPKIAQFLQDRLHLELHPRKVTISTFASGVDFLGWVHFTDHRVLRTTTKRRMMRRLRE